MRIITCASVDHNAELSPKSNNLEQTGISLTRVITYIFITTTFFFLPQVNTSYDPSKSHLSQLELSSKMCTLKAKVSHSPVAVWTVRVIEAHCVLAHSK